MKTRRKAAALTDLKADHPTSEGDVLVVQSPSDDNHVLELQVPVILATEDGLMHNSGDEAAPPLDAATHCPLSIVIQDNETEEDNDDADRDEQEINASGKLQDEDKENNLAGLDESDDTAKKKIRKKRGRSSFICPHCGYSAQSNPALNNHVRSIHEKQKPYLCDICGFCASAKNNLDMHKAIKHDNHKNVSYSCEQCGYQCSSDQHLKAHCQIVHVENVTPFECGTCRYQCRKRCLVVKHMRIVHEKSKPYQCQQCPRSFSANCILLRHIEMVHEKVRPYACDVCGYAFAERRFLQKHVRTVHDKAKPFACSKCDYKCAMKDSLTRHMYNKHERREKFKCRICSEGFRKRIDMEEHYKSAHDTPFKPYACTDCNYCTDKKFRLEKHQLTEHTGGSQGRSKSFKCKQCKQAFNQHIKLVRHCRDAHGVEVTGHVHEASSPKRKRGVGRPPKADGVTTANSSNADEEMLDEFVDDSDSEWRRKGNAEEFRSSRTRRVRRPKTYDDFIMPFPKKEPMSDNEEGSSLETSGKVVPKMEPRNVINEEDYMEHEEEEEMDDEHEEDEDDDDEDGEDEDMDDEDEDEDEDNVDEDGEEGSKNRSIKFTVRTKGQMDDTPIELEIEIKDHGHGSTVDSIEEKLQCDAQTVVNILSDGAVVDAIMSVEKKEGSQDDDEPEKKQVLPDAPSQQIYASGRKSKRYSGSRRSFLCDICGYTCTSRQTLNTHHAYKHGNLKPQALECDECGYRCDLLAQLNSHKQIVHVEGEVPYSCNLCPQQYKTEVDLDRHLRAIHLDERPFVCNLCKHGFNKKSNLIKHVRMVHERLRPYQCDQCEWNFGERRDLQSHVDAVHKKIKPFSCDHCDFRCARNTQLRVHLSNVHRAKPMYECESCGHRFVNRAYLRSHIRSVHEVEVRRYQCGYCGFSSVTKLSVDRHMTIHTKEKRSGAFAPMFCSFCGETFTNHSKLAKHVRLVHNSSAAMPKKVYECSSCSYKAGTHSLLKAHVRSVHENERRFKCDMCEFTSFAKSALKRHIAAIHEKCKPYFCDMCDFRTSYKESIDLHMATVHKQGDLPKRVVSRRLKKQGIKSESDIDEMALTGEIVPIMAHLDETVVAVSSVSEETVEVDVPPLMTDEDAIHIAEVTVIAAQGDDPQSDVETVHEITL